MRGWKPTLFLSAIALAFEPTNAQGMLPGQYDAAYPTHDLTTPEPERARILFNQYSQCLINSTRQRSVNALKLPVGGTRSLKALSDISISECLSDGDLHFDGMLLRGSLFRALYRADFTTKAPGLSKDPIDYASDLEKIEGNEQYIALHEYAECVVRSDPEDVRGIVLSATASSTETRYLGQLSPHLGGCLPKGSQIKFTKPVLFGVLSEVLYRISIAW